MNKIITLLTIGVVSAFAQITPSELMTKVYGKYDSKAKCWHNEEYCMKIDNVKIINNKTGKMLYLLATGDDKDAICRVCYGCVGAFIVKEQYGTDVIVAQNKMIEDGVWGEASTGWKLVKLGSNDYWGWINDSGDGMILGTATSWYKILAPYGERIKSLGQITSSFENMLSINPTTSLDSKFKIDDSNKNVKIYPLLITVSGINNGKKIKPIQYKINFDLKKWQYIVPSNYILE
jgi:hypothetical protein